MIKSLIIFVVAMFCLATNASADCAADVKSRIDFAYNEGGLTVKNIVGPIYWNEGVIVAGQPSLASKVSFAVNYLNDTE
jgi:hypothetical protein